MSWRSALLVLVLAAGRLFERPRLSNGALLAVCLVLLTSGCGSSTDDADQAAESEAVEESTSTTSTTTTTEAPPTSTTAAPTTTAGQAECERSLAALDRTLEANDDFYDRPSQSTLDALLAAIDEEQAAHTPAFEAGCAGVTQPASAWWSYWDGLRAGAREHWLAVQ